MPIATYAGKVFQVDASRMHTFYDMQYSSELQTEKQDAEGKKPSTYNKGPGLDNFTFKIKLDSTLGVSPRIEWESWMAIKDAGIAYPFILGGRPIGKYQWLVVNVEPSNFVIDNFGNVLSLELSLQFDEYVRPGSKKEDDLKKASMPGVTQSTYSAVEDLLLGNKTELKRKNPRMIQSGHELSEMR